MRSPSMTVLALVLSGLAAIGTTALAAPFGDDPDGPSNLREIGEPDGAETRPPRPDPVAGVADAERSPGTSSTSPPVDGDESETAPPDDEPEPVFDCRTIDGTEICDTFGEHDEGPGTTTPEPVYDCRTINGTEICDTFGEHDEGPGTTVSG